MEETLQLLSFLVSFFFGFFFHMVSNFHFKITEKYPVLFQYLSTFLFLLDAVLLYIFILYYLNGGVLHIYFLIFLFLGFFLFGIFQKRVKLTDILSTLIAKIFHR